MSYENLEKRLIKKILRDFFQVVEYEGSNHIKNPEMQRVLLTHEVICRQVYLFCFHRFFSIADVFPYSTQSNLRLLASVGRATVSARHRHYHSAFSLVRAI